MQLNNRGDVFTGILKPGAAGKALEEVMSEIEKCSNISNEELSQYIPTLGCSSFFEPDIEKKIKVFESRAEWLFFQATCECSCGDCEYFNPPIDGLGMGGCSYEGAPDFYFINRADSCGRWKKKKLLDRKELEAMGFHRVTKDTIFEFPKEK